MIPHDKLDRLQHKCKGQGKENLYYLIGVQGAIDHQDLRRRLARKRDSWSKMADKDEQLKIVEYALELLQTASDKAQYDRFLQQQAPPVGPQQQPWGHEQAPMPTPPYQPRAQPKRRGKLSDLKLALVGLALLALSLLMTGTVPWGVRSPVTTENPVSSNVGTATEGVGPPAGAPGASEERTSPSNSSSRDTSGSTGTESVRSATTAGTGPGTAAATTTTPPPVDPARDSPPARPTARPETPVETLDTPNPEPIPASVATRAEPAPEPAVPLRPDPLPVVEPVRVGGNVAQPRKTWSVQPEYPRMARLRRIEGIVILEVTVDRQGNVSNVSVLRADAEGFGEAAVEAVRQWRYEPTIINGRPVSVVLTDTVRFQL